MREKPFLTGHPDHGAGWLDALTTLAMQYSPFGLALVPLPLDRSNVTATSVDQPGNPPPTTTSYRSVLQRRSVQIDALSRFLSRMGGQTLSYGILVFLAAGVAAMPANFGSTSASQAVQVYINRNVPVRTQGASLGWNRCRRMRST